jgi:shikimate kinase
MVGPIDKPIVLLGFMGSGKTTLGRQVAGTLGFTFIDLDRFIETEEKRTISDIFNKEGESAFRKMEQIALARILVHPRQVIAVGGGAPCQTGNMALILEKALSVYLKVSGEELYRRLANSTTTRPLLSGKSEPEIRETIYNLLAMRESYYLRASLVIESDTITSGVIVEKINSLISPLK